ncbi:MAG: RNA methyltransferase [Anaerolineaceae bacterium]|nr:RNA methyltransferase [Anaerolineaceae bacterium]
MVITSTSNQKIKEIRKLHARKERERTGLFFIEGIRLVAEALEKEAEIETIIYSPQLLASIFAESKIEQFANLGGNVIEVSGQVFRSLAKKEHPQGIAAVVHQQWHPLVDIAFKPNDNWIVLETIRDPGNLGTILRTLDGIGGAGVILLGDCCDPYDATATRASMGAIFTQSILKATFEEFASWKKEIDIPLIGTSDHEEGIHYREYAYSNPVMLMMGSERAGLPKTYLELCDGIVTIPMEGSCDSLNLSIATGIVLYEIHYRQQSGRN